VQILLQSVFEVGARGLRVGLPGVQRRHKPNLYKQILICLLRRRDNLL